MTFEIGETVEIICHDGAVFVGVLTDFTHDYITIDGRGYPLDDVRVLKHHG